MGLEGIPTEELKAYKSGDLSKISTENLKKIQAFEGQTGGGESGSNLDSVMAVVEGLSKGLPFSGPARELGRFLGEKITGNKVDRWNRPLPKGTEKSETFSDVAPIAGAIGEGLGAIPGFVAGGIGAAGSKIPLIAGKGLISSALRGGLVNTLTSQSRDPSLDPVRIGTDIALGGVGEAAPAAALKTSSKFWKTILGRSKKVIADEIKHGNKPVEELLVERGSKWRLPRTMDQLKETFGGLGTKAQVIKREGAAVMPERNAIISRAGDPNPETVVGPLKEKLAKYRPGWGKRAKNVPGTGMPVRKLKEAIDETLKWLDDFGSAKDVESLKEIQQDVASNLYSKGELPPTENVVKQIAKITGRGARESLEEAAGPEGARLASLNKTYGNSREMTDALADAAASGGKGIGKVPIALTAAATVANSSGQTKAGKDIGADNLTTPLLLMAALFSPAGRQLIARGLAKSSQIPKVLAPFVSGSTDSFMRDKK